jgi:predicted small secreted protein
MRVLMLALLAAGSLALPACNTAIGMSRDIQALGVGMENVAHGRRFDGTYQSGITTQPSDQRPSTKLGRP